MQAEEDRVKREEEKRNREDEERRQKEQRWKDMQDQLDKEVRAQFICLCKCYVLLKAPLLRCGLLSVYCTHTHN